MKHLSCLALILVVIGALNWGLVGLFNFDLVFEVCDLIGGGEPDSIGEAMEAVEDAAEGGSGMYLAQRIVYILVALAGVFLLVTHFKKGKSCPA